MARVSTTTARFNPFTMEELYAPVLRATEKHLEQQEKYDELANQAEVWKYRIDPESTQALEVYNTFMNNMNAMVDDLNANGILNPSVRDNFSALRRSNPIPMFEEAWKRQQADNLMRAEKGDNTVWAKNNRFDDYLTNKVDNTSVNLNDVLKQSAGMGANLAKTITSAPEYSSILGGQYWQSVQKNGIPQNVFDAVRTGDLTNLNDDEAKLAVILGQTIDDIKGQIGYSNYDNNPLGQQRIDDAIWNGMRAGIETTDYGKEANRAYLDPARSYSLSREKIEDRRKDDEWNRYHNPDGSINYDAYYADKEEEQNAIDRVWQERGLPEEEKPNVLSGTFGTKTSNKTKTTTSNKSTGTAPKSEIAIKPTGYYTKSANSRGFWGKGEEGYDEYDKLGGKFKPQLYDTEEDFTIDIPETVFDALKNKEVAGISVQREGRGVYKAKINNSVMKKRVEEETEQPSYREALKYYDIRALLDKNGEIILHLDPSKTVKERTTVTTGVGGLVP